MSDEVKEVPFEGATYYAVGDPEELSHESPEEALEAWFDYHAEPGMTIRGVLTEAFRERETVTVKAYDWKEVTDADADHYVQRIAEDLVEWVDEEYGDPNGDIDICSDAARARLEDELRPVVARWMREDMNVWQCYERASRDYTFDEVLETLTEWMGER